MSMIRCDVCEDVFDSDDYPDGFYMKECPEGYVCEHCVHEQHFHCILDENIEDEP